MTDSDRFDSRASEDLRKQVRDTFEHTTKVMDNLISFIFNPQSFDRTHKVDISSIAVSREMREDLPLLVFIHDFYKLRTSSLHAPCGAAFLADPITVNLVRFHDVFGIVNTGEASLLFLDDLAATVEKFKDATVTEKFLSTLLVLTAVDVAAYGYLNQSRIDVFKYLISLIIDAPKESEFREKALADTANRIRRLIEANNRIFVATEIVERALREYADYGELTDLLVTARFDLGAYSLEPLIRTTLFTGSQYLISDTSTKTLPSNCTALLCCFFDYLLEILRGKNPLVGLRDIKTNRLTLKLFDMRKLSIKGNENLKDFLSWAERFKTCVLDRATNANSKK